MDKSKERWSLLPYDTLKKVVKVFTFGAKKYTDDGWKTVKNAERVYFDAAMRHLVAYQSGEEHDDESNLPPIYHAIADLLICAWHASNK